MVGDELKIFGADGLILGVLDSLGKMNHQNFQSKRMLQIPLPSVPTIDVYCTSKL
jgi:hypothetical protein